MGDKAPDGCCIQDGRATVARDDTTNTEAGSRGFHGELVVAALQPCRKVRPGRDKNLVRAGASGAPTVDGRGMEGRAIFHMGFGEEISANNVALDINTHQLGSQVLQVLGLQAGVIDT